MSHSRNLKMLQRNRIIYKQIPVTDVPTEETDKWMYFEEGTYQCYDLFGSTAKINTHKSLKWHLLVLWYLNPNLEFEEFKQLARAVANKKNGFVSFEIKEYALNRIMDDVYWSDLDRPPKNRLRKVVFKAGCGLEKSEKLSIVGSLIGKAKRLDPSDIYQCMIDMHDSGKKITIQGLSELLGVSKRTIHRNMPEELKKEKKILNKEL